MPRHRPTDAIFLNVPFDPAYRSLFEAMVFAVFDGGFQPRCALNVTDAHSASVKRMNMNSCACHLTEQRPIPILSESSFALPTNREWFFAVLSGD